MSAQRCNDDRGRTAGNAKIRLHVVVRAANGVQHLIGERQSLRPECRVVKDLDVADDANLGRRVVQPQRTSGGKLVRSSLLALSARGNQFSKVGNIVLFTHIAISFMLLVVSFCRSNWAHGSHDCKSAGPSPIGVPARYLAVEL